MKKGLACLGYSQKYITLYKSTLEIYIYFFKIHNFLFAFYY